MPKTDFFKCNGAEGRTDCLLRISERNYLLIYGQGTEADGTAYHWRKYYDHRPTASELRADLTAHINRLTDEAILSGFAWRGTAVWLSAENQLNFKAAYDLAVQTSGATLPVTFKLGEAEDGKPVYHTFTELAEFTDFYTSAVAHITAALASGWAAKDALDPDGLAAAHSSPAT